MEATGKYKKLIEFMVRKQTISAFLVLVFFAAAFSSIFVSPRLYRGSVHEGDIALKNTYAPYDFTYFWEIDEEKTQKASEEAVQAVPYFLQRDADVEKSITASLARFFDKLDAEKEEGVEIEESFDVLRDLAGADFSDKNLKALANYSDLLELKLRTLSTLEDVFLSGYIDEDSFDYLKSESVEETAIISERTGSEIKQTLNGLVEEHEVRGAIEDLASKVFTGDRRTKQAAAELIFLHITPNLKLDEKKTEARRESAEKKALPVYREWPVKKNELVIEKGKRVNARHIAQVSQLRRFFRPGMTPTFFMGALLLFVLLGLLAFVYLYFTSDKNLLESTKNTAIVLLNMFLVIIMSDFIVNSPQPSYFIPMAGIGMIITLLVSFNVAFISVLFMSIFISLLIGGGIELVLVLMVGSAVGMFVIRDLRRRTRILGAGFLAGMAKFASISCVGLINGMGASFYIKDGIWGIASGLFSGFIVLGLLPAYEHIFKVPTNISLLELSDLNHPLLKRLAIKAPGTYHHSIMVGNLAESACDSIGANSLLARVGSYYHDIGKIPKAEYFSENEISSKSRHTKLAPSMSALIIAKHVKEGIGIAKKHKLNTKIIEFITQHHGDSLISFFYQRAMEQSEDGTVLNEDNFRYAGPRPQTKENAIVLLADSVEASSRALDDPTPASIRNLVKKIINNKFIDGQLDECDLTLKDMHQIADSFVRVLMGIFHTRLDYPEDIRKNTNGSKTNGNKSKPRKSKPKKKN